jgi:hypothetical protein
MTNFIVQSQLHYIISTTIQTRKLFRGSSVIFISVRSMPIPTRRKRAYDIETYNESKLKKSRRLNTTVLVNYCGNIYGKKYPFCSANFFHGENMSECCNNGIESLTSLLGPPGLSELLSQISFNDPFFLTVTMTDLWLWKNGLDAH